MTSETIPGSFYVTPEGLTHNWTDGYMSLS